MTDEFTTYDAAYLLGALNPQDRADYEAHLLECDDCRHGVNQLAGLPGLLAAVPPERAREAGSAEPDVPKTLLPKLLAEVQRARFRRRWTNGLVGAAAAAAVTVAVAVAFGLHSISSPNPSTQAPPSSSQARHMTPVSPDLPITATAWLADKAWGTQVTVRCTYEGHASPDEQGPFTYTMVIVDKSGHTEQIAEWAVIPGEPAVVDGSTSVPQSKIASVQVLSPDHQPILQLEL